VRGCGDAAAQRSACSAAQCSAGQVCFGLLPCHPIVASCRRSSGSSRLVSRHRGSRRRKKKVEGRRREEKGARQKGRSEEEEKKHRAMSMVAGMSCHCMAITSTLPTYIELSRLDTYARPNKQTNKQTNKQVNKRERERREPIPSPPVRRASSSRQFVTPSHAMPSHRRWRTCFAVPLSSAESRENTSISTSCITQSK
jgi:hypothetical protein